MVKTVKETPNPKKKKGRTFKKRPQKQKKDRKIVGGMRVRNFCWTLWDPTIDEKEAFQDWEDPENLPEDVKYIVAQLENAGDREHLQGYCELKRRQTLSGIKKIMGVDRIHIEKRRGSQKQAIDYCRKEESRVTGKDEWSFEAGARKRQGQRTDNIEECVAAIDKGDDLDEIEDDYPVQMTLHRSKLVDRYIRKKGKRKLTPDKKNNYIFFGPSGSGKSTTAWSKWPNAYKGQWPKGGRWWWGEYEGQKVAIFDEFRENLSYQDMLALLDIHPMDIEYKGGNTQNVTEKIIITSVRDPCEWYGGVEDKSELERRINENCTIVDFDEKGKYPNFVYTERGGDFTFDEYVEPNNYV